MASLTLAAQVVACGSEGLGRGEQLWDEQAAADESEIESPELDEEGIAADQVGDEGDVLLGSAEQAYTYYPYYPYPTYPTYPSYPSYPTYTPPPAPSTTTTTCSNPEGVSSTMAALVVAAGMELGRWQPTRDFAIGRVDNAEALVLTSGGRARCSDGYCANTQALLDFQKSSAQGKVVFPGNVLLDVGALRSRLVAKFRDQLACEMQPSNGGTTNCPVEEHTLTFLRSEKGGCDTYYYFQAKGTTGAPLKYPEQLKNKLLWADKTNPYIGFQSVGDVVAVDPLFGLNTIVSSSTSTGSCSAICTRFSASDVAGQCCSCNGAARTYKRAIWNTSTYLCQ